MSLKDQILERIRSEGPMPFEEFMRLSLYSDDGFFGGATLRSEKAGDFLTSPEVSSMFGETLARFVDDEHQRLGEPFRLVEVAGGSGSLLGPLLSVSAVPALAVEVSPAARSALSELVGPENVFDSLDDIDGPFRGVIIANELIDNLPMAVAQKHESEWRERWVGAQDGELQFVDAEPRPEVAEWLDRFGGDVATGGWVEVQLDALAWLRSALNLLEKGSIVLIDYGDTAKGLEPRRADGTLRTYRAHHLGPHPLDEPGETDITADVNFTALEAEAQRLGASTRLMRQDDFLTELGLRDRLSQLRHEELEATRSGDELARLKIRSMKNEAETLLHPRGLGDFRALVVTV